MSQNARSHFDLETAVATWRHLHARRRVFLKEDLDELEQHLRDHTAHLLRRGLDAETAFDAAVQALGDLDGGADEYRKVYWGKLKRRRQRLPELRWRSAMLKNYLKIALRNLYRQKGYAFINVAGLSVGLACSFFILLWVLHETSVDRFHETGDRIYRVLRNEPENSEVFTRFSTAGPMAATLKQEYPEVENATPTTWSQDFLVTYGDKRFRESGNFAGADFFEVFTFPLIQGDPAQVLDAQDAVVISESLARRLFGADWQRANAAVGQRITIDHRKDFTVTGVARDVPDNSTIQFDLILPIQDFFSRNPWTQVWGSNAFALFVRLREGASPADVNAKIAGVMERHSPDEQGEVVFLHPFEDLYLHGNFENGVNTGGRIELVRLFAVVAVFLLAIAVINFMNLATARSSQRSKEIGVRKSVGATRPSVAVQFMAETMLLAGVAFVIAVVLVAGLLPVFNTVTGKQIGMQDLSPGFTLGALGIALVAGLLAGSYPALYLSSFNPVSILRGTFHQKPGAAWVRKGLVVFQFAISTLIIVATVAVYFQTRYIMEKDLGLDRSHLVSVGLEGGVRAQYEAFRQELMKKPGILNVTTSSDSPLSIGRSTSGVVWEGKDPNDEREFSVLLVNYDFVETMRMEMASGRSHARPFGADSAGYVINEAAARLMEKATPVGERISLWGQPGPVIGVVRDFHMTSLETPIRPTLFLLDPANTFRLWVRTEPGRTQEALAGLEAVYKQFNPDYPFDYTFLDGEYEEMYRSVFVMGRLAGIFALIAVLISCLGLFGLASFTAEQRTKEIGVRKVLGASASRLVAHLTGDFTKLVLAGILLAMPVAYVLVQRWLDGFAYHAEIGAGVYALAGVLAVSIAWLTVSYQAVRAALADPVESLRYE